MKRIDEIELRKIQMELLDYFDAFCKRNHLNYWLDGGTLLGAVRHKGYIPWDDDIDVAMLREDFTKAAALFPAQAEGPFAFLTPTNDRTYAYPFGKVINTDTVLYEYGEKGIKTGVYIDVFVYDNSPEDAQARKKLFRNRDFLGRMRRLQLPRRAEVSGLKRAVYTVGAALLKPVSKNALARALDKNARRYEHENLELVSDFADPYDYAYFSVPKAIFQTLTQLEFEGKLYPAPKNYDVWLPVWYGNYMELPPVEQRVRHHVFEAYYLDK